MPTKIAPNGKVIHEKNALVRANYQNVQTGVMRTSEYLERFSRNLLLGENNELRNRYMVVNVPEELAGE